MSTTVPACSWVSTWSPTRIGRRVFSSTEAKTFSRMAVTANAMAMPVTPSAPMSGPIWTPRAVRA